MPQTQAPLEQPQYQPMETQPQDDELPPQMGGEQEFDNNDNLNSFGKEKFDAGVGDEDEDPKKYIEKLTGKLAQKLRDFNDGESDANLSKYVINMLIPASIPQMDDSDAKDVIKKVKDNIGKTSSEEGGDDFSDGGEQNDNPEMDNQEQQPNKNENQNGDIDDLINEFLSVKKLSRNVKNKNPFQAKKFK